VIAEYMKWRDEVTSLLKTQGSAYFHDKSSAHVGLYNQGATCYLNSLLQTLYMTPEFRRAIFCFRYEEVRDGRREDCIPFQLQLLFARLNLSLRGAVSTKGLTHSFGWTHGEAFQQHDVQELNRVLFSALERCGADFSALSDLYRGELVDYIQDKRWPASGERRARIDPFFDLQVDVRPSLSEALDAYVLPEVMEGENAWRPEAEGDKVDALKGLSFQRLPDLLTLHVRRFIFDYSTLRRIKLNDPMEVPMRLSLQASGALQAAGAEGQERGPKDGGGDSVEYELCSILIHAGSAMGGHYHCYAKETDRDSWFDFNDATATELSQGDLDTMLGAQAVEADPEPPCTTEAGIPDPDQQMIGFAPATAHPPAGVGRGGSSANAYMLLYRRTVLVSPSKACSNMGLPEELVEEVEAENSRFSEVPRALLFILLSPLLTWVLLYVCFVVSNYLSGWEVKRMHDLGRDQILEIRVHTAADRRATFHVLSTCTWLELTAKAQRALCTPIDPLHPFSDEAQEQEQKTVAGARLEDLRLRKLDPFTGQAGQTFGGRNEFRLEELRGDLGCGGGSLTLLLEIKSPEDSPWKEYNPNECIIRVALWRGTPEEEGIDYEREAKEVTVPGEHAATDVGLHEAARKHFEIEGHCSLIYAHGELGLVGKEGCELKRHWTHLSLMLVWLFCSFHHSLVACSLVAGGTSFVLVILFTLILTFGGKRPRAR